MNKKELLLRRNQVKHLIRISNRHRNALFWSSGETDEHIDMKLSICKYLKKYKLEFYSEAIFEETGDIADIVVADWKIIIEVFDSESKESMIKKQNKYPLDVIFVDAKKPFDEKLIL